MIKHLIRLLPTPRVLIVLVVLLSLTSAAYGQTRMPARQVSVVPDAWEALSPDQPNVQSVLDFLDSLPLLQGNIAGIVFEDGEWKVDFSNTLPGTDIIGANFSNGVWTVDLSKVLPGTNIAGADFDEDSGEWVIQIGSTPETEEEAFHNVQIAGGVAIIDHENGFDQIVRITGTTEIQFLPPPNVSFRPLNVWVESLTSDFVVTRDGSVMVLDSNAENISETEGVFLFTYYPHPGRSVWMEKYVLAEATIPAETGVTATGGTITTNGPWTVHSFTGGGTHAFTVTGASTNSTVEVFVVGGGGGGGAQNGGGGGGGAHRYVTNIQVTPGSYVVTVGAGGTRGLFVSGQSSERRGKNGLPSSINIGGTTYSAAGGGGGGNHNTNLNQFAKGLDGGSGGGGADRFSHGVGGSGNPGGRGGDGGHQAGGGGGSAAQVGRNSPAHKTGGNGGNGVLTTFRDPGGERFAGGGGGGGRINAGAGGTGGGGNGSATGSASHGQNGRGGGGGGGHSGTVPGEHQGGNGGSGIVMVRYLTGS